jgi:hypothetical protein
MYILNAKCNVNIKILQDKEYPTFLQSGSRSSVVVEIVVVKELKKDEREGVVKLPTRY